MLSRICHAFHLCQHEMCHISTGYLALTRAQLDKKLKIEAKMS